MNYDVLSPNKDFFFRVGERGVEGVGWAIGEERGVVSCGMGEWELWEHGSMPPVMPKC